MTKLRQDALSLLEEISEDKLVFIIQIMEGVTGLYGRQEEKREKAFHTLEQLRKKAPVQLDDGKELAAYRKERFGNAGVN